MQDWNFHLPDKNVENGMRVERSWHKKRVYRALTISENVNVDSFRAIITKYIFSLNPSLNYLIQLKIRKSKDKKIETVSHIDAMKIISELGFDPKQESNNEICFLVSLNGQPFRPPEEQDKQDK